MTHALLAGHADDDLVAFGAAGTRTARDLLRDSAVIAAALPDARPGSQVLFVVRSDRYVLAASLLATLAKGHAIALPPELGRAAITTISEAPETVAIVHDTASGMAIRVDELLRETRNTTPLTRDLLRTTVLKAKVFSRARDGQLVCSVEGADWLSQAAGLASALTLDTGSRVASSVSPAQAYGIVFGVLSPLLHGGAFLREHLPVGADFSALLSALKVSVLVSVPAHLQCFSASRAEPTPVKRFVSAIHPLSSGVRAKLEQTGAVVDLYTQAPVGVLPWRATSADDQVEAAPSAAGSREVPYVPALAAGDLEAFLCAQGGVTDAAVAVLQSDDAARQRVVAALVGASLDVAMLRAALAAQFGPKLAGAELLTVNAIRRDSTGSFERAQLLGWFRLRADGRPLNFALTWGDELATDTPDERACSLHVPPDYAYFEGHFPGYPILPGAAQLNEIVLPYVRRVRPDLNRLLQMTRLKFSGRIQPGETIEVALSLRPESPSVDFVLRRGRTICTAGTLQFAGKGAAS